VDDPRPEKVAVVADVRQRLSDAHAAILTEYRGLTVAEMAELRRSLAHVGGEYKVFKNTLVKLAVAGSEHEPLQPMLVGPTAIAFVSGDVSAVAKALRDFSRTAPALVLKGGYVDGAVVTAADLVALADLPPREVLLARVAGAMAAPLQQMAGLLAALPRNLAYGLKALVDQGGASSAAAAAPTAETDPADGTGPADDAPVPAAPNAAEPDAAEPDAVATGEATAETGAAASATSADSGDGD
jgi:large subunit ribosomal protein L10